MVNYGKRASGAFVCDRELVVGKRAGGRKYAVEIHQAIGRVLCRWLNQGRPSRQPKCRVVQRGPGAAVHLSPAVPRDSDTVGGLNRGGGSKMLHAAYNRRRRGQQIQVRRQE